MSKPEDIPQDIWETAQSINQVLPYSHVQGRVARAILEEREACAAIAERDARFHIEAASMNLPVSPGPIIAKDRAVVAKRIAAAIRQRGDVNTAHNKKSQEV